MKSKRPMGTIQKSNTDHICAFIKAGLSTVPGVGGPIASLIGDYVPSSTMKSVKCSIEMLTERLKHLEGRIDPQAVNRDEFAELFKSCFLVIVRTTQKKKLNAAAALLANMLLKKGDQEKLPYTEVDHMVRCLDGLSIGSIEALGIAYSIAHPRIEAGLNEPYSQAFNFEKLAARLPDYEPSLLMGLVGELNSMNLLHMPSIPTVRTRNYGNYPIELTPLGTRFVKHLLESK